MDGRRFVRPVLALPPRFQHLTAKLATRVKIAHLGSVMPLIRSTLLYVFSHYGGRRAQESNATGL
ncbi:hypothetical protein KCP78_25160 [Salmonella enterica subsp. enterica]|nr:hypothetical protein KCP78_25160 [Salmonella enterica subsp. enterica]